MKAQTLTLARISCRRQAAPGTGSGQRFSLEVMAHGERFTVPNSQIRKFAQPSVGFLTQRSSYPTFQIPEIRVADYSSFPFDDRPRRVKGNATTKARDCRDLNRSDTEKANRFIPRPSTAQPVNRFELQSSKFQQGRLGWEPKE
jgi:hypothetical protein